MSVPEVEDLKGKPAILPTRKFDLFQIPPFLGVGEPYVGSTEYSRTGSKDSEHRRNFAVGFPKEEKFLTLAGTDSDKYAAKEKPKGKEDVIKIPFRVTSPTKKPSGSGSPYGCFSSFRYMTEQPFEKSLPKNTPLPKPNIRVQPPRKGYGNTPHILIGGKEYGYVSEAEVEKQQTQTPSSAEKKERSKVPIPLHWKRTGGLFDSNVYRQVDMPSTTRRDGNDSSGGSSKRKEDRAASPSSTSTSPNSATRPSTSFAFSGRVFRPTSPNKTGWEGTFNRFEYMSPGYYTERPYSVMTNSSSSRRGKRGAEDSARAGRGTGRGGEGSGNEGNESSGRPSTSPGGTRRSLLHEPVFRPVGRSVFVSPQPSIAFYRTDAHRTFLNAHAQL